MISKSLCGVAVLACALSSCGSERAEMIGAAAAGNPCGYLEVKCHVSSDLGFGNKGMVLRIDNPSDQMVEDVRLIFAAYDHPVSDCNRIRARTWSLAVSLAMCVMCRSEPLIEAVGQRLFRDFPCLRFSRARRALDYEAHGLHCASRGASVPPEEVGKTASRRSNSLQVSSSS